MFDISKNKLPMLTAMKTKEKLYSRSLLRKRKKACLFVLLRQSCKQHSALDIIMKKEIYVVKIGANIFEEFVIRMHWMTGSWSNMTSLPS